MTDRDAILTLSTGDALGSPPTISSNNAQTNRWVALTPVVSDLSNYLIANEFKALSTSAADKKTAVDAYNASPLALTIPQGTAANQRLGASINVIKDKWKFTIFFNSTDPSNSTLATPATTLVPRRVKIRLIGLVQKVLLLPGSIGYTPFELFENVNDRLTHFKRGDAQGYEVVYDKTKTLALFNANSTSSSREVLGPHVAVFGANFSYRRDYAVHTAGGAAGGTESGSTTGEEITINATTAALEAGTSKGQILWYYYIEDMYPVHDNVTADKWYYPGYGYGCRVKRRTYWTDA